MLLLLIPRDNGVAPAAAAAALGAEALGVPAFLAEAGSFLAVEGVLGLALPVAAALMSPSQLRST